MVRPPDRSATFASAAAPPTSPRSSTEDPLNVAASEGQLDAKISNYYIGGQTQNVLLVAPSGSRNIAFGLGMDNVTISSLTHRHR